LGAPGSFFPNRQSRLSPLVLRALLVAFALTGGAVVAVAQPRLDATRHQRSIDAGLTFVPDGTLLAVAASGFHEPVADLLWVRMVLTFGERSGREDDGEWAEWLRRMTLAVVALDPDWRTPHFYGGVMLRVTGAIDASDEVLRAGMEHLPEDPFFPFSLGMNAFLYRGDLGEAARLLHQASRLEGAPSWYAAASARMKSQVDGRPAALRYLEEQRASTSDPAILQDIDWQVARLRHDEIVEGWADACRQRKRDGLKLGRAEDVRLLGHALPENPRKDDWIVGLDGVVRSAGAERERLKKTRQSERRLLAP
jgi:hypothetical protein